MKFLNGADQVLIDENSTVFLSIGTANRYLEDTPIPVTFTTKTAKLSESINRPADLGPYEGVPLGVAVPSFSANLPKGYVLADGQANWPNADWVPVHLRGKKVPDLDGRFLRGVSDVHEIGVAGGNNWIRDLTTMNDGAHQHPLPVHRHNLAGEGTTTGTVSNRIDEIKPHPYMVRNSGGGWCVGWIATSRDPQPGNGEGQHRHDLEGETQRSDAKIETEKGGSHSHIIADFEHVPAFMQCRWIIRVE